LLSIAALLLMRGVPSMFIADAATDGGDGDGDDGEGG
jgi:hypothetical protein